MPQRQTKFSETWLSLVASNGQRIGELCRKGQNEYQAYCQFCDVQVKCDNAGKTQLLQHSKQKKHIDAKKQKKLVAFSKQSGESSAYSSLRATGSANLLLFRMYSRFCSTSLFYLVCVDRSGSLSGGAFNQLKLVTLNIVLTILYSLKPVSQRSLLQCLNSSLSSTKFSNIYSRHPHCNIK